MTTPPRTRKLTSRETGALAHLAAGHPLPRSARGRLRRAMKKLGVATEAEAAALAKHLREGPAEPLSAVRHMSRTDGRTAAGQGRIPGRRSGDDAEQRADGRRAGPGPRVGGRDNAGAGTFEELYESSHARLVQQVFLLTACRHRAAHCVRRAFAQARRGWGAVAGSGDPEGWVRVRACELALSPWHRSGPRQAHAWRLPHRRIRVRPADESQAVLPDHDRLTDRDRALLKALKRLSRPQRWALVLHDGLGLPAAAVAVEVESTLAAAEGRVWVARASLAQWVPNLVGSDPGAPGFADRLSRLLHGAAVRGCPQPHRPAVPVLRARHGLRSAALTGAVALLMASLGGAAMLTLTGGRPAALFREPESPEPSVCVRAPDADEPRAPVALVAPGRPPGGISSLWCSPTPGLPAVVMDPPPRAAALWQLPAAAREAGAPPPQGPPKCARWAPLPCTPAH
ncbi:RNA polymerase sigma factor [Kitasatospora sp. NPDC001660]